jgi:hypothetical protein
MKEIISSSFIKLSKIPKSELTPSNPFPICEKSVGKKKNPKKFEKCVHGIKRKNKKENKKSDKESNVVKGAKEKTAQRNYSSNLKNNNIDSISRKKINQHIHSLGNYFSSFSKYLDDVKSTLSVYKLKLIQEDGTDFEGIFTGEDGRANISLGNEMGEINNSVLSISWHKMIESGNYEIIGYLS